MSPLLGSNRWDLLSSVPMHRGRKATFDKQPQRRLVGKARAEALANMAVIAAALPLFTPNDPDLVETINFASSRAPSTQAAAKQVGSYTLVGFFWDMLL